MSLFSLGQNRTPDNDWHSAGSPDCNGGNEPGSGNLLLACDDGGYDNACSVDLKFEIGPIYLDGRLRNAQAREPQQRRHRLQQSVLRHLWPATRGHWRHRLAEPRLRGYDAFAAEYPQAAPAGIAGATQRRGERIGVQVRRRNTPSISV